MVLERAPRDEPEAEPRRQLRTVKWGLVPAWSRDPKIGSRLVNARSEAITEKPSFRAATAKRRRIIPAAGYFEWMKDPRAKTGHIHERSPVILPTSSWEHWLDPSITDRDGIEAMVNSIPEPHLHPYEVSTDIDNVRNNRPELLEPVDRGQ